MLKIYALLIKYIKYIVPVMKILNPTHWSFLKVETIFSFAFQALGVARSHGSEVGSHQQGEEGAREKGQEAARSRD